MNEQPTPPADGECCESECSPCVWDTYYEEMRLWREAEAKRKADEASQRLQQEQQQQQQ